VTLGQGFLRVLRFPLPILFHHGSILIYHIGMNSMPVGGRSSESLTPLTQTVRTELFQPAVSSNYFNMYTGLLPTDDVGIAVTVCTCITERHGRVVNNPASYSGGPGFKSRPGDRLS
jgi:hypothetical protein